MLEEPPGSAAEVPPRTPAAAAATIDRRALIGAGGLAGLAGLGGALGVGYWLNQRRSGTALTTERARIGHLLRRAGFAPSSAELDAAAGAGLDATIDRLLHPELVDDSALEKQLAASTFDLTNPEALRHWWMIRMAFTRRPLTEKLTLFWHGLLTTSYRKVGAGKAGNDLMHVQNELFRQHGLGRWRDLLVAVTKDGAMLRWLDLTGSTKAHPNENYARELMELFTMGVGHYTELDVRESARALTGWYVDQAGTVGFRPKSHDDGVKTFLGRTGNLGLAEVIDTILATPYAPHHLADRLWTFFAYPGAGDATLQPVIDAYHRTGGDLRAMLEAIFRSDAFYSARAYRALVKSPVELIVGVSRQFGLPVEINSANAGDSMGQSLLDPPNVAGWPGGADWMSTGSWMARMRYLIAFADRQKSALRGRLAAAGQASVGAALDHMASVMVDGNLTGAARQAILEHADAVASRAGFSADVAADLHFLLAATPEYQLA